MSDKFFNNPIIEKLRKKEPVSAAWAQMGSSVSAEILAEAGFDALVIDMEHAPVDIPKLVQLLQSTKGTDCVPFVRAPWNDLVWCKQILDAGAQGIHIPYVSTKEEAEYAVKSCKYAPEGWRGIAGSQRAVTYGLHKEMYYKRANEDIVVMAAIETPEGVENIDEIVRVEGLDGIFIGPGDLSASMGYIGNPAAREVRAAIAKIENVVLKSDKFLGTVAPNVQAAKELYDKGYSIIYFLSDVTELASRAAAAVGEFNQTYK